MGGQATDELLAPLNGKLPWTLTPITAEIPLLPRPPRVNLKYVRQTPFYAISLNLPMPLSRLPKDKIGHLSDHPTACWTTTEQQGVHYVQFLNDFGLREISVEALRGEVLAACMWDGSKLTEEAEQDLRGITDSFYNTPKHKCHVFFSDELLEVVLRIIKQEERKFTSSVARLHAFQYDLLHAYGVGAALKFFATFPTCLYMRDIPTVLARIPSDALSTSKPLSDEADGLRKAMQTEVEKFEMALRCYLLRFGKSLESEVKQTSREIKRRRALDHRTGPLPVPPTTSSPNIVPVALPKSSPNQIGIEDPVASDNSSSVTVCNFCGNRYRNKRSLEEHLLPSNKSTASTNCKSKQRKGEARSFLREVKALEEGDKAVKGEGKRRMSEAGNGNAAPMRAAKKRKEERQNAEPEMRKGQAMELVSCGFCGYALRGKHIQVHFQESALCRGKWKHLKNVDYLKG